jgi:hypothetical protein
MCAYPGDAGCSAVGVCVPLVSIAPDCITPSWCDCHGGGGFLGFCGIPADYSPAPTSGPFDVACALHSVDASDDGSGSDAAPDAASDGSSLVDARSEGAVDGGGG